VTTSSNCSSLQLVSLSLSVQHTHTHTHTLYPSLSLLFLIVQSKVTHPQAKLANEGNRLIYYISMHLLPFYLSLSHSLSLTHIYTHTQRNNKRWNERLNTTEKRWRKKVIALSYIYSITISLHEIVEHIVRTYVGYKHSLNSFKMT